MAVVRRADDSDELIGSPSRKRARPGRSDATAYVPGAIMRVRVHNFMTHSDVTFEPGPRLNVVIGPNGTGKSAFVCAVCVGLGGSTKLLGRAGAIQDFVKRGEESAWTEITLRGPEVGKPIIVRRDFKNRDGGQSTWKINGESVRHEDVLREMKALNMQLDNLCSFLPQDRVSAFSMLNPQELLMETEKAIGKAEMFHLHEKLKSMKSGIEHLERSVEQKTTRLEKLQRDNENLERDVQRLQEREKLIKEAEEMSTKIPWLKYDKAAETLQTFKAAYDDQKEKVKILRADHQKKFDAYQALAAPFAAAANKINAHRDALQQTKNEVTKLDAKSNKLLGQQEGLRRQLNDTRREAIESKKRLEKRQAEIRRLEASLDEVPEIPRDLEQRRDKLKEAALAKQREIVAADDALQKAGYEKRPIEQKFNQLKIQKATIESVRAQKIESLSQNRSFSRIKEADDWVQRNRPTFHGEVLGPLLAEMEVTDPTYQNYIEQHLGPHVLATYIVTDERDESKVSEHMKAYRINVWTRRSDEQHVPGIVSSELRQAGVVNTLDNVFKAKSVVKQALNDTHNICKVFVGDNTLDSVKVNQLFQAKLSTHIYCPQGVYLARRSRYAKDSFSMIQNDVRPSRLFVRESSTNIEDVRRKLAEAEQELRSFNENYTRLEKISNEKKAESQAISRERTELNKLAAEPEQRRRLILRQIEQHKTLLAEQRPADFTAREKSITEEQKKLIEDKLKYALQMCDAVEKSHAASKELTLLVLKSMETQVRQEQAENTLRALEARIDEQKAKREDLKEKALAAKQKALDLKAEAIKVVELTKEVENKFEQWPPTIEELEYAISQKQEQADAILCHNPMVLDEFNRRRAEMVALTRTLETEKEELAVEQAKITNVKNEWLPQLRRTVEKISEEFSSNFARIGCAGQVALAGDGSRDHDGFGDNFREYSLEIRVKFRPNEDMHLLDAHRQSGGERSVTTMLYMIALQSFTSAPFRVVDEINQGMDSRNERKVFKRMVEAASIPGTPQCFVVTPKLLTQLEYSEDCTVMCIFNGPHVHEMAKRWHEMQQVFDGVERRTLTL